MAVAGMPSVPNHPTAALLPVRIPSPHGLIDHIQLGTCIEQPHLHFLPEVAQLAGNVGFCCEGLSATS